MYFSRYLHTCNSILIRKFLKLLFLGPETKRVSTERVACALFNSSDHFFCPPVYRQFPKSESRNFDLQQGGGGSSYRVV